MNILPGACYMPSSPLGVLVSGTFHYIIGAVLGTIIALLLLIILNVCVILSLKRKKCCVFFDQCT